MVISAKKEAVFSIVAKKEAVFSIVGKKRQTKGTNSESKQNSGILRYGNCPPFRMAEWYNSRTGLTTYRGLCNQGVKHCEARQKG